MWVTTSSLPEGVSSLKLMATLMARAGLPAAAIFGVYALVIVLIAALVPVFGFTFIDWVNDKILERLFPDRFVQPLLRSLVITNTVDSRDALFQLDAQCSRDPNTPRRIKSYVAHAFRVQMWSGQEAEAVLIAMLADSATSDYAIDRLGEIGAINAVSPLLMAARSLDTRAAVNAITTAARLAKDGDELHRAGAKEMLHGILDPLSRVSYQIRKEAYSALITLGENPANCRRPRHWDMLVTAVRLRPSRAIALAFIVGVVPLIWLWLSSVHTPVAR